MDLSPASQDTWQPLCAYLACRSLELSQFSMIHLNSSQQRRRMAPQLDFLLLGQRYGQAPSSLTITKLISWSISFVSAQGLW